VLLVACAAGTPRRVEQPRRARTTASVAAPDPDSAGQAGLCLGAPEDLDGWEDQDGCADPDNDQDRILDSADRCPNDPETTNGHEDEDGCPDSDRVVIEQIVDYVFQKLYFRPGDAAIHPLSVPALDENAATIRSVPRIVVQVAGHRAAGERDRTLGMRRAQAVIEALIARGIEASRLQPVDLGATRPIDRRRTAAAAERNRRVEFYVLPGPDGTAPE
jgi:outer membrane protein OmpA-like peptidoglycan-associated protein